MFGKRDVCGLLRTKDKALTMANRNRLEEATFVQSGTADQTGMSNQY